jgi:F-type H+-transporting ATPase subunit b
VLSLDLDVTYLIVLALLLVPTVILNNLAFGPFLRLFAERHEQLEGALVRAHELLTDAEHRAKAFEERISVATSKGIDARNRLRALATTEMNAVLEQERGKIAKKVEAALDELKHKRREALADAHVEATRLAEMTAQKLLGRGF